MDKHRKWIWLAVATGCLIGAARADDSPQVGRRVFEEHCRTCHGGTARADLPIGPDLAGIVGAKAGTRPGGSHSRATLESTVVWDRDTLRSFLSRPRCLIPNSTMPNEAIADPAELERLLDYLESLH